MYDQPLSKRFQYLLDTFHRTVQEVAVGTGLSESYLYYLLKGEREKPSQDTLEKLAGFFGISPLFFSRNQSDWVPPVSGETIQYALRTAGDLDERARLMLERLMQRAKDLAEKSDGSK